MGRKIAVVGTSGNGKTTVARALSARLGVPHVELDALFHGRDWESTPVEEFRRLVAEVTDTEAWVVDGNYQSSLGDLVLRRADTIVWLDQPLALVLWRVTRRTVRRIRRREELWNGNRETWRGGFWGRESMFVWTIRSHLHRRREFPAFLARLPQVRIVRLRTPHSVDDWLAKS